MVLGALASKNELDSGDTRLAQRLSLRLPGHSASREPWTWVPVRPPIMIRWDQRTGAVGVRPNLLSKERLGRVTTQQLDNQKNSGGQELLEDRFWGARQRYRAATRSIPTVEVAFLPLGFFPWLVISSSTSFMDGFFPAHSIPWSWK